MRSNLSKALKLNCGESGCLEGREGGGAVVERAACCTNPDGDNAHKKSRNNSFRAKRLEPEKRLPGGSKLQKGECL